MQATKRFHEFKDLPDGVILKAQISAVDGNVHGKGIFLSGPPQVDDREWTFSELEAGVETALAGPGLSWLRIHHVLAAGAEARIDIRVFKEGQEIRHRFWVLEAVDSKLVDRCGVVVTVNAPADGGGQ